jgi:hypothetical protein
MLLLRSPMRVSLAPTQRSWSGITLPGSAYIIWKKKSPQSIQNITSASARLV